VLERPEVQTGAVADTIAELRAHVYLRHEPKPETAAVPINELAVDAEPSEATGDAVAEAAPGGGAEVEA
jgi:hypothetical protein